MIVFQQNGLEYVMTYHDDPQLMYSSLAFSFATSIGESEHLIRRREPKLGQHCLFLGYIDYSCSRCRTWSVDAFWGKVCHDTIKCHSGLISKFYGYAYTNCVRILHYKAYNQKLCYQFLHRKGGGGRGLNPKVDHCGGLILESQSTA